MMFQNKVPIATENSFLFKFSLHSNLVLSLLEAVGKFVQGAIISKHLNSNSDYLCTLSFS